MHPLLDSRRQAKWFFTECSKYLSGVVLTETGFLHVRKTNPFPCNDYPWYFGDLRGII